MAPGLMMDAPSTSVHSSPGKLRAQRPEPLLEDNPDRFCMFPIKYPSIWEMYKKAEASFWTGASYDTPVLRRIMPLCPLAACLHR